MSRLLNLLGEGLLFGLTHLFCCFLDYQVDNFTLYGRYVRPFFIHF